MKKKTILTSLLSLMLLMGCDGQKVTKEKAKQLAQDNYSQEKVNKTFESGNLHTSIDVKASQGTFSFGNYDGGTKKELDTPLFLSGMVVLTPADLENSKFLNDFSANTGIRPDEEKELNKYTKLSYSIAGDKLTINYKVDYDKLQKLCDDENVLGVTYGGKASAYIRYNEYGLLEKTEYIYNYHCDITFNDQSLSTTKLDAKITNSYSYVEKAE